MTMVLRVGVLAIATGVAFVAGRASSKLGTPDSTATGGSEGAAYESSSPTEPAPWAGRGFREGETCQDVFQNPG